MDEQKSLKMEENEPQRTLIKPAAFAITARIAMQLGRESISSSVIALIEIVKNAYDADAESVKIRFADSDISDPTLIIEDDGTGMTLQQFTDNWLVIGTDNKLVTQKSRQKRRVLTGEKGLGRLGLDRLCESAIVQTFTENDEFGIELEIDWRKYEHSNAKLESIEHNMYRISKHIVDPITNENYVKEKGTRLILRGLKDDWSYDNLKKIIQELALLVSPFGGINDFSIFFHSEQYQSLNGKINSGDLLEAADWKIVSKLEYQNKNVFISHTMLSPLTGAMFEFPPTLWSEAFQDQRNRIPECGPAHFEFYFIPREDVAALSLKKAQVSAFMDANQGIRIYRDGFRVMPYGKPSGEGDWLSLSLRRTRSPGSVRSSIGEWKVGYNQILGAIFIEREKNKVLTDQTNREGIVESTAFNDLRRFALHGIEYFEKQRQRYEKAQGPKREDDAFERTRTEAEASTQASKEAVNELKNTIDSAVKVLENSAESGTISKEENLDVSTKLSAMFTELNNRVVYQQNLQKEFIKAVDIREEERKEEFQRQKDTLGNLASLGILATTFGHETEAASNLLLGNTEELRTLSKEFVWIPEDKLNEIMTTLESIEHGAKQINTFAIFTLKNVARDKRQRNKIFLDKIIKKVFESFSASLEEERGINISFEFSSPTPAITAFSIDWESILINFITNAIWALNDTSKEDRKIRVRLQENNDFLCLSFADSGCGIAAGTVEDIFLPTFSTKRARNGDIVGTGMGLAIVQNFIEAYGGSIHVESPCDLGGAEFHIEVPIAK